MGDTIWVCEMHRVKTTPPVVLSLKKVILVAIEDLSGFSLSWLRFLWKTFPASTFSTDLMHKTSRTPLNQQVTPHFRQWQHEHLRVHRPPAVTSLPPFLHPTCGV